MPANNGWTLKGVPPEVITLARQTARERGMFLGAFVAQAITQFAETSIENVGSQELPPYVLERLAAFEGLLRSEIRGVRDQGETIEKEIALIRRGLLPLIKEQ